MIVRTEFSFRTAYGSAGAALARCGPGGGIIADDGTWGHVAWRAAGEKAGVPTGLGWRCRVSAAPAGREDWRELVLVATSAAGLRALYGLVRRASERFHWWPRLLPADCAGAGEEGSGLVCLATPARRGAAPPLEPYVRVPWVPGALRGRAAAFSDNFYPAPTDREAWLFSLGAKAHTSAAPQWILTPGELRADGAPEEALRATAELVAEAGAVPLPRAENIRFPCASAPAELRAAAESEFLRRGLDVRPGYRERMERELVLIAEKGFADYFLVIADMIAWAKARMLVGPGRGSSAGSIVCWLLRITEVDPIEHGLLFERFIDVNRFDTPDIDIDFPDVGREAVLSYLAEKYGQENVAHLGTVMRYKPKSALTDVARELRIPPWELDAFKDSIIERSSGDSRVNDCLADTFAASEKGQELLAKYPQLSVAAALEGGARQSGKHAAGMIVCNEPVSHFCGIGREGVAQLEKKGAERLNALKIDALGLRTLSVLDTALSIAGMTRDELYALPLDDERAFAVFNEGRFSNVFQFEGNALQSLCRQIEVRRFEDISALTALGRPGPLGGGEATRWIARHEGAEDVVAPHPALAEVTAETFGTILYQEQVMMTTRTLGNFSWADTAAIRKLMSNRSGEESFRKFEALFLAGAAENGVPAEDAEKIWKAINSFGSWAFNKSHAVVYGVVSYWCAYMKAHHPLAFAAGCLRHARDTDSALATLRELRREGIPFTAMDRERSGVDWEVHDGRLIGGLTGIPGVGTKTAHAIVTRRRNGMPLTPAQERLLQRPSVFENLFPIRRKYAAIYADPRKFGIVSGPLYDIDSVPLESEVVVLGRLIRKSLRDMNDERFLVKRNGVRFTEKTKMLIFHVADDTARIICLINRWRFEEWGARIAADGVEGKTHLLLKGYVNGWRLLDVQKVRWLE